MIHVITTIIKFLKNNFEWFVIPFLVVIILKGIICPLKNRNPTNDTILIPSDSPNKSVLERDTRLQILLNSIHQHQGFVVQSTVASENL
ncbi:MAG: hypothetical protein ABSD46_14260, partial [Bacteroidota bacterium]